MPGSISDSYKGPDRAALLKDAGRFQEALGDLIDMYLRDGSDPELLKDVLRQEADSDIQLRAEELEAERT